MAKDIEPRGALPCPAPSRTTDSRDSSAGDRAPCDSAGGVSRRRVWQLLRRWAAGLGFGLLAATGALWACAGVRFMLPNALSRARRRLKLGRPQEFPRGCVDGRFRETHGIWVVHGRYAGRWQIVVLSARCTHLGCMVRWNADQARFQCPCHGSSFSREGLNLAGPAPRPLVRHAIRIAEDGRLEVDLERTFQEELGQWADPASYVEPLG